MKKFLSVLFFVITLNSGYAGWEYRWVSLYTFEENVTFNGNSFEYYDETYVNLGNTLIYHQTASIYGLVPGETYKLKVTYDNTIDSCFTVYDFVRESYQVDDDFWMYENNGILASPDGFYGIYNVELDAPLPYDDGDYSDLDPDDDFFTWMSMCNGPHFVIGMTGLSYIKIEILAYREVYVEDSL